jgi:hypothetical protein
MEKTHSVDCVYRRLATLEYKAKLELQAAAQKALLAPKREAARPIPGRAPAQRWPDFLADSPVLRRAS